MQLRALAPGARKSFAAFECECRVAGATIKKYLHYITGKGLTDLDGETRSLAGQECNSSSEPDLRGHYLLTRIN